MAYSKDLRERALAAVRKGYSKTEVNRMFWLGINTLKTWEKLEAETGSLENRPLNRFAYKINREELLEWYKLNPFSTNQETAIAFNCSVSGIRSAKQVLGITRKKRQYSTQNGMSKNEKNSLPK
jgi:transposase